MVGNALESLFQRLHRPLVAVHSPNKYMADLVRVGPQNTGVDLRVLLAGVANQQKATVGEVAHDPLDRVGFELGAGLEDIEELAVLDVEVLEMERAPRQSDAVEEVLEVGLKLPRGRRDVVKRCPLLLPLLVEILHALHHHEVLEQRVRENPFCAGRYFGHLDGVVDVRNDAPASLRNEIYLAICLSAPLVEHSPHGHGSGSRVRRQHRLIDHLWQLPLVLC
mmetsp:Transcript_25452/g.59271  ORF Transcript_25452/g.59271 Transcript_25452/m.59271 type:complete len:222 (-) Transcript_25452:687-1352(-)